MDCHDHIIIESERKRGQHLGQEERDAIQQLSKLGYSLRSIAAKIDCSASTVLNELRRGTPQRKSAKGRRPEYSAKRGLAVYKANRLRSKRRHRIVHCTAFVQWVAEQVRTKKWSIDVCVGHALLHHQFAKTETVCTKTLYNELAAGNLPLSFFDVPLLLRRKPNHKGARVHKRLKGRSIDERPAIVAARTELGHWEADTVIGRKSGKEAAVLTLVERVTNNYLVIRIPGKNSESVLAAMEGLRAEYGEHFSSVFKSITTDNGSEFEDFSTVENWGSAPIRIHPGNDQ